MAKMIRFIQTKNPKTQTWVEIDKKLGRISRSGKRNPYKNVLMYEGKKDKNGEYIFKMPK